MLSGQNMNESRGTLLEDPLKASRGWVAWIVVLLLFLGGLGGGVYLYWDELCNKLGPLISGTKVAEVVARYYCPMHPQVQSNKPGTCPICNMNLVKMEPEKEASAPQETAAAPGAKPRGERKILFWVDPMNPGRKSDKPGKAPDGMDLVPVYEEEAPAAGAHPPGTVKITPEKQQLIGVQHGEVSERPLSKTIRAVGRLAYDETRIARIQTRFDGWIDTVHVDFTGKLVKKGQPLFSVYSPELVSTQQELLIAAKAKEYLGNSGFAEVGANASSLYNATRERLRLWNISDQQIREIEKRGAPARTLTLYSPIDGFVLARNAYPGQRITAETELYSIADLKSIWVLADIYEYEIPEIRLGQAATMSLSYFPGKTFKGKVDYIYPELDKVTRTLKVRIQFPNPDFHLKPDMYANVELRIDYGTRLAVPEESVLDSGMEQIVFVSLEGGYFEPRRVTLGEKVGNFFIVQEGLKTGERVVTSANFLIDSESKLKSALGGMTGGAHAGHGGAVAPETGKKPTGAAEQKEAPQITHPDHTRQGEMTPANGHAGRAVVNTEQPASKKPVDQSGHGGHAP